MIFTIIEKNEWIYYSMSGALELLNTMISNSQNKFEKGIVVDGKPL
jgi:hypothetical protein